MFDIPTFWFDKDGVLAKYDYSLYEPEAGAPAPWTVRNAHVFRNIEPYENVCEAFSRLYAETVDTKPDERICNLRVLTAVSDGITLSEHVLDGAYWCNYNLGLRNKDFYACAVAKESIPIALRREITSFDVLFDDYNPNLKAWKAAGGTAVKVLNGINSSSTDFPCIQTKSDSAYLYKLFKQMADDIKTRKGLGTGFIGLRAENA